MMHGFYDISPVQRVMEITKTSEQMSQQNFHRRTEQKENVGFSEMFKEACRNQDDKLSSSMENKVDYYGSNAQAVYYTMTASRNFQA